MAWTHRAVHTRIEESSPERTVFTEYFFGLESDLSSLAASGNTLWSGVNSQWTLKAAHATRTGALLQNISVNPRPGNALGFVIVALRYLELKAYA